MSADVVTLAGDPLTEREEADEKIIGYCEEMLELARGGHLTSIAICATRSDGATSHRKYWTARNHFELIAGVAMMQFDMLKHATE